MPKLTIPSIVAGFSLISIQSHAAITKNDLSGLSPLNALNTSVVGISLNPLITGNFNPGITASFASPTISIAEAGPDYIGFGPTVPLGTDLTSFTSPIGTALSFAVSNPTGVYYAPFYQDPIGGITSGVGYLTFNYDNSTESLAFVSSTVQDTLGETLLIPEPASASLGALGLLFLVRRRR